MRMFSSVKSSAMTPRQPSVPKLIATAGGFDFPELWRSDSGVILCFQQVKLGFAFLGAGNPRPAPADWHNQLPFSKLNPLQTNLPRSKTDFKW
jgi:hypothetical protein